MKTRKNVEPVRGGKKGSELSTNRMINFSRLKMSKLDLELSVRGGAIKQWFEGGRSTCF